MLMLLCVHVTGVLFLVLAGKFCPDYGLLLELHTVTLVDHSYVCALDLHTCTQHAHTRPECIITVQMVYFSSCAEYDNL